MCGIHATISVLDGDTKGSHSDRGDRSESDLSQELRCRLCARGPDFFGQVERQIERQIERPKECGRQGQVRVCLTSTVLALRGDGVTEQPQQQRESGSVWCWNGEAWAMGGQLLGEEDGRRRNDGEEVFLRLQRAMEVAGQGEHGEPGNGREAREAAVLDVLRSIDGPFAFVFLDRPSGRLYFGRDRLGRRSLLLLKKPSGLPQLTLSSVSDDQDPRWKEVEADGIYVADLLSSTADEVCIDRKSWLSEADEPHMVSGIGPFQMATNPPEPQQSLAAGRWPPYAESACVDGLLLGLAASLRPRVLGVPRPPLSELAGLGVEIQDTRDTRIAVLFSGGLDCTVLARLCHDVLPAEQGVDLINVAFENPRVAFHLRGDAAENIYEACPDRITGRKSFAELKRTCPRRAWRFLAVNVPYSETQSHRPKIISIMHPHNTEMDLSIASALYFAARGVGKVKERDEEEEEEQEKEKEKKYATPARVLLSGLGADELFGGYGRHQVAFARGGYGTLVEELLLDVARLGKRNLGRDDRVMAHWSKEVRFPFLDEKFVRWAMGLPAWEKCDFGRAADETEDGRPAVEPAKRVLRLAALQLGLEGVAREKKRAIQFGARTAKMESGKIKGTATVA